MKKTDLSLSVKEKNRIKYFLKLTLLCHYLPLLPDEIEELLFLHGIEAWKYRYSDSKVTINKVSKTVAFDIGVKLIKRLSRFAEISEFNYSVTCKYYPKKDDVKFTQIKLIK